MALPTVSDCKEYLRIEHTAEDTMLTGMLAQAVAAVEAEIGRPITTLARTFVLECNPSHHSDNKLFVPMYPIATSPALTLADADSTALVAGTDYRLDTRAGIITAIDTCFSNYPYTIVATVGLGAFAEYDARIEPALSAAILDVVADRYQRRNPAATAEDAGGGVATSSASVGLPQRVKEALAPWRIWNV